MAAAASMPMVLPEKVSVWMDSWLRIFSHTVRASSSVLSFSPCPSKLSSTSVSSESRGWNFSGGKRPSSSAAELAESADFSAGSSVVVVEVTLPDPDTDSLPDLVGDEVEFSAASSKAFLNSAEISGVLNRRANVMLSNSPSEKSWAAQVQDLVSCFLNCATSCWLT